MKRKSYSKEYKVEALALAERIGVARAASDLGLRDTQLYAWRKQRSEQGEAGFVGKGHVAEEQAELRRLRRENDVLKQERDILKKATAFFAKVSR